METQTKTDGKTSIHQKRFKVSFDFVTEDFSFASGLEAQLKAVFPNWEKLKVEKVEEDY